MKTISQMAQQYNLSTRTLRYYEQIGLLRSIRPEEYSYRCYDENLENRLNKILLLKEMKIPLKDIKLLLENEDNNIRIDIFHNNIQKLELEIIKLQEAKKILENQLYNGVRNAINKNNYKLLSDFESVSFFLKMQYNKYGWKLCGMLREENEYSHTHCNFDYDHVNRFMIWEENKKIIAFVCYDTNPGDILLSVDLSYTHLYDDILNYAEDNLSGTVNGKQYIDIRVNEYQKELIDVLKRRQYKKYREEDELHYYYNKDFPKYNLPAGYKIITLEDENDLDKIHKCMWSGYNHGDEPDDDRESRIIMQSGPNYRKDLTFVVKGPNDEYVCYLCMWKLPDSDYAFITNLCTVPKYRDTYIAQYAMVKAMEKTFREGAKYCMYGFGEFYKKIGFEPVCKSYWYRKEW